MTQQTPSTSFGDFFSRTAEPRRTVSYNLQFWPFRRLLLAPSYNSTEFTHDLHDVVWMAHDSFWTQMTPLAPKNSFFGFDTAWLSAKRARNGLCTYCPLVYWRLVSQQNTSTNFSDFFYRDSGTPKIVSYSLQFKPFRRLFRAPSWDTTKFTDDLRDIVG